MYPNGAPPGTKTQMQSFSIPPFVHGERDCDFAGTQLPLNLIALIISFIEDAGDLARFTRASRVFHYMTLPRLYESVTLHSYDEIRYIDGRPEGFGGGSPFAMALNGLITRNVTHYIKRLRLWGEWKEADLLHLAKGRLPDSSLLLSITIRAAIDKMPLLEFFSWELNTKPHKTVYDGLAARPALRSLQIRFPSTRVPRPTAVIPPMPNLRSFSALDIDPLCYPDDMSLLLLHARKLEALTLHFHPRIRENAEPSVNIHAYFGQLIAAKQSLHLRHLAFHNLYGAKSEEVNDVFDEKAFGSLAVLNCGGAADESPMTVFLDDTWRLSAPHKHPPNLKQLRVDVIDKMHIHILEQVPGLERIYVVSARRNSSATPSAATNGSRSIQESPVTPSQTPPERSCDSHPSASAMVPYLNALTSSHGATLTHLLLSHHWVLGAEEITQLVRSCPNLTQLGIAMQEDNSNLIRLLIPFLIKLYACRVLMNPSDPSFVQKLEGVEASDHEMNMGLDTAASHFEALRWVGIGRLNFEFGRVITETIEGENGVKTARNRRLVKAVPYETVKDIAIWRMDTHDVEEYQPVAGK